MEEEEEGVNGDDLPMCPSSRLRELSPEELRAKEKEIKRLKSELRNEEMKLILLKKIKQSQLMKENITSLQNGTGHANSGPAPPPPAAATASAAAAAAATAVVNHSPVKGQVNARAAHQAASSKSQPVMNPPISHRSHGIHGHFPPPMNLSGHRAVNGSNASLISQSAHHHPPMRSSSSSSYSSTGRPPATAAPNHNLGYAVDLRGPVPSPAHSGSQIPATQNASGSPGPNMDIGQTPAQRQAAAKLALRKQLEKTLLQIPPPKPPPPEMNFIPNPNNQEFIYYLGLETIVDFLIESEGQNKAPPEPFECVQCNLDFTPVWKWQDRMDEKRGRPAVICENCVTSNIKKALKAEHTNRLKTAFVKALQQEQEIEQRIASGSLSPPLPSLTPPSTQANPSHAHNQHPQTMSSSVGNQALMQQAPPAHSSYPRMSNSAASAAAAAAAAVASSAALLQQMPKLSAAQQSLLHAQAQQLQQLAQSLPQPQPAHMLPFAPLLYQYGMLGKPGALPNDLHRQYLLDMIPSRSLQQNSGMNWKS